MHVRLATSRASRLDKTDQTSDLELKRRRSRHSGALELQMFVNPMSSRKWQARPTRLPNGHVVQGASSIVVALADQGSGHWKSSHHQNEPSEVV